SVGWLVYLMAVLEKLDRAERAEIAQRFQLTADIQESLRSYKSATRDIRARLMIEQNPSALYFSVHEYPLEIVLYAMARSSEDIIRQQIADYLRDLRKVRLQITGDDLREIGVPQSPKIKEILDGVLRAHLDGTAETREQQLELAKKLI